MAGAEDLTWKVKEVRHGAIFLRGVLTDDDGPWDRVPHLAFEREEPDDADGDMLRMPWTFTLVWARSRHSTPQWMVTGYLLGAESWQILTFQLVPLSGDAGVGLTPITARVLREVPLGLVHDALFALRVEQVHVAIALWGDPDGGVGEWIDEGRVPSLWVEDGVTGERIEGVPLPLVVDLAGALRLIQERGVTQLTRQRPRAPSGRAIEDWPTARPTGGRPPRSHAELRRFAEDFLAVGGNYKAVCKARAGMPIDTAKSWVRACRREGWLAPGQPGRRGSAAPGWRLLELMEGNR